MQNFLLSGPAIAATSSFSSSAGHGQVGFADTRDVASVAAEIAAAPDGYVGKTYLLTRPQLLSYADVAAALSEVLGRPIAFHERTREVAALDASIAHGDLETTSPNLEQLLGRPAIPLVDVVRAARRWRGLHHPDKKIAMAITDRAAHAGQSIRWVARLRLPPRAVRSLRHRSRTEWAGRGTFLI